MPSDLAPVFSSPDKAQVLAEELQKVEFGRAADRALIDGQFNGQPPFTPAEAESLKIEVNVNWGEGGKILDDANRQLDGALIFKSRLAVISARRGPPEKRVEWGEVITTHYNELLQRTSLGRYWMFMLRSRNASLSLHGIGALLYTTKNSIKPRFIPLSDLLIPTDTNCDHENLAYFFVNLNLTQGELFDMAESDPDNWNQDAVRKILECLQNTNERNQDPLSYTDNPEKWVEWRKQNRMYYYANNDAVPVVQLRMLFYRDPKEEKWYRKVLLRFDAYAGKAIQNVDASKVWLYESDEPYADNLDQFLQIQYGDSSRVPPLKHHSVRGIGTNLFSAVECMNRVFCQVVQHVFQDLLTWFRIDDPADRDRLKHFVMEQFVTVPRELNIIPKEERYQPNQPMVDMVQARFRQLMNESSASYVRDINDGTSKEMTLGEAQIRLQQVNVQISGMLKLGYAQERFLHIEQLRRLLMKGSTDKWVKRFQKRCEQSGIPKDMLEASAWDVDIEQVLGAGDQTLAQYQANLLLSQTQWMDPSAQRVARRDWITVTTNNPDKARLLMPETPEKITDGAAAAQNLFATLMTGAEIEPREGIDQTGYIDQMLTLMGQKVVMIAQTDEVGTPQDVIGLQSVARDIAKHIAILAEDQTNKQLVKQYSDALGQFMNQVKAFQQRQQQAMQKAQQQAMPDPKAEASAQAVLIKAQVGAKIKEITTAQKLKHLQAKFELEEARKNIATMNELNREDLRGRQELAFKRLEAAQKILDAPEKNGSDSN